MEPCGYLVALSILPPGTDLPPGNCARALEKGAVCLRFSSPTWELLGMTYSTIAGDEDMSKPT